MKKKTFFDLFLGILGIVSIIVILFVQITQNKLIEKIYYRLEYSIKYLNENIIYITTSVVLSIFVVIMINKLIKNNGNKYFNRKRILLIGLPLITLICLITFRQIIDMQQESSLTWWSLIVLLIFPIGFIFIFVGIVTEYYEISNEKLFVKKGIFNKLEKINIKDIFEISSRTDFGGEGVECYYIIKTHGDKTVALNQNIDDIHGLINKILSINSNIYITLETQIDKPKEKLIPKIIGTTIIIILYTIDFNLLIKTVDRISKL